MYYIARFLLFGSLFLLLNGSIYAQNYTLPIVLHIVHRPSQGIGFGENISLLRIQRGMDMLNAAFDANAPFDAPPRVPSGIQFCLAQQTPSNSPTEGYTRTGSNLVSNSFNVNDDAALKNLIQWDAQHYLNIWLVSDICNGSDCAPTAYSFGDRAAGTPLDGLVCEAAFWGTRDGAAMLAHEIGHYLGLQHTYNGGCTVANCNNSGDNICDTPPTNALFKGCGVATTCSGISPNNNFMDANTWSCLHTFTPQQVGKMQTILNSSRQSLKASKACAPPCMGSLSANILVASSTATVGQSIGISLQNIQNAAYQWQINGSNIDATTAFDYTFYKAGKQLITVQASDGICASASDTVWLNVQNPPRTRYYVNGAATGNSNGQSWQNAFTNLYTALQTAPANTEIWIAQGVYAAANAANPRGAFVLAEGTALYGGFDGSETQLDERDAFCNETILTAEFLDAQNQPAYAPSLIRVSNSQTRCHIERVTLQNTAYDPAYTAAERGALYVFNSNIDLVYCKIRGNTGVNGAGLVIENNTFATVRLHNCSWFSNVCSNEGAAIYAKDAAVQIENAVFYRNRQTGANGSVGSVVFVNNTAQNTLDIQHATFVQNEAKGAIVSAAVAQTLSIRNSIIQQNHAPLAVIGNNIRLSHNNFSTLGSIAGCTACIDANPLFVDTAAIDIRLSPNSPCVDMGDQTDYADDQSGGTRIINGKSDMGAYEYAACMPIRASLSLSPSGFNCQKGSISDAQITLLNPVLCHQYAYEYQGVRAANGRFIGLPYGEHFIVLYDLATPNCKDSIRLVVGGIAPLQASALPMQHACNNANNGVLLFSATGGTPPLLYALNNIPTTLNIISRLPPNTYTVTVRDANNCLAKATTKIETLLPLVAHAVPKDYNCANRIASVQLDASSGTIVQYAWAGPTTGNAVALDSIAGLTKGDYIVTVTSSTGCSATASVRIDELAPITARALYYDPVCLGSKTGSLQIVEVQHARPPLEYSLNDGIASTQPLFTNLSKGTYLARVEDRNNCKWERTVILEDGINIAVSLSRDTVIGIGDSAYLRTNIQSINPIVSYAWSNTENLNCYDCAAPRAFPLVTTVYTVTITDSNGCTASDAVTISVVRNKAFFVPTVFTPNNDGINDFLSVYSGGAADHVSLMRIYNRWGGLLYEGKNIPVNNPFMGWNGTYRGELLDNGVYIYEIEVEFIDSDRQKLHGDVTLLRR